MTTLISAENLGKSYTIQHEQPPRYQALRDVLAEQTTQLVRKIFRSAVSTPRISEKSEEFWALKNVSFSVSEGDRLGIIGRNGAGKSTLLKVLSRITEPTEGRVRIRGRIASLLEVGTGFHPELTGRENIFLNGAILGMSKVDIRRRFDEIVAFAEIERFLDTPVKRYSSGMYMRLAFAVAAHLEPDILVVDEVLAVGDSQFQKKCMDKMGESGRQGKTVLFVSHNMGAISELCTRAILLDCGGKIEDGEVSAVIERYMSVGVRQAGVKLSSPTERSLPCVVRSVRLMDSKGVDAVTIDISHALAIEVQYEVFQRLQGLQLTVTVSRGSVDILHTFDTDSDPETGDAVEPGSYCARHSLPEMFLKAGYYSVRVTLGTPEWLIQDLPGALHFDVGEFSFNTQMKGFRKDRPGQVISPGKWDKRTLT